MLIDQLNISDNGPNGAIRMQSGCAPCFYERALERYAKSKGICVSCSDTNELNIAATALSNFVSSTGFVVFWV